MLLNKLDSLKQDNYLNNLMDHLSSTLEQAMNFLIRHCCPMEITYPALTSTINKHMSSRNTNQKNKSEALKRTLTFPATRSFVASKIKVWFL